MSSNRPKVAESLSKIEPGRWVVGVSGGADSVALLVALTRHRTDLTLLVAHLNHESRATQSDADEHFVLDLCSRLGVPCVSRRISQLARVQEANLEARFRAARLALFQQAAQNHNAVGVLLAHHADDRAETTLMRLLRNSDPAALDGLRFKSRVGGLRIVRPFLSLCRSDLVSFLREHGQTWRTDASNESDAFARNRVRKVLASHPRWTERLLRLADGAAEWRAWIRKNAPVFADSVPTEPLADLPDPLARHALRRWLGRHGVADASPAQINSLIVMARDRSAPSSINLPGGKTARRRAGRIEIG